MKLKFDSNLDFQLDAVRAVTDLFQGLPLGSGMSRPEIAPETPTLFSLAEGGELGFGNALPMDKAALLRNLRAIQERNDLEIDSELLPLLPQTASAPLNFSVEMETGTGKTYVYLRTAFELSRTYGFKKFVIVVPSVAIREGVLKTLALTTSHFREIFPDEPYEFSVYDGKRLNKLRQFAQSSHTQILIINIDAFRKNFIGTDNELKSNLIYRESDRLSGKAPIDFIRITNPIVIVDEPQSVDSTEKAQDAIRSLNPLCTLRYSATHRNPYNLVYRLDPVAAFRKGLVKQIVVSSVTSSDSKNQAYVKCLEIGYAKGAKAPHAVLEILVESSAGLKKKKFKVKGGEDLYLLSGESTTYQNGLAVDYVDATPGSEHVAFVNGTTLRSGSETGGMQQDAWRAQIRHTVRKHLEKELQLRDLGIKVLSLFFIDRVSNYRVYSDEGAPKSGPFAIEFEAAFSDLLSTDRFKSLKPKYRSWELSQVHNGYFSQDKKGQFKDSNGTTLADEDTYALIMREKERLLSMDEPLRFIFSHSALKEGWDNPNVFQICTLNETQSTTKKRQEIGRGLRLPVNQNGDRVSDANINRLHVVANESYEEFARKLQTEYEEDCGVTFGKLPKFAFAKLPSPDGRVGATLGRESSQKLFEALVKTGILTTAGHITQKFSPDQPIQSLPVPAEFDGIRAEIFETLANYRLEKHIQKDEERRPVKLNKQVLLTDEFRALWDRIKLKTHYSVEFESATFVDSLRAALNDMPRVEPIRIRIADAAVAVQEGGVRTEIVRETKEQIGYVGPLPDLVSFLQEHTNLTRKTLVEILTGCKRLGEFISNPRAFLDMASTALNNAMKRLLVDGVKYERIAGEAYEVRLFETEEISAFLHQCYEVKSENKCLYDAVIYDSSVEREFAQALDSREDIKCFVKLPRWFEIPTPLGNYNPDWAIVKHDESVIYMVRETKGTINLAELREIEAAKIKCGKRHFMALDTGVSFEVVQTASEI